jgi:hypothetical protein
MNRRRQIAVLFFSFLWTTVSAVAHQVTLAVSQQVSRQRSTLWGVTRLIRGGSTAISGEITYDKDDGEETESTDAYTMLANAIQSRFRSDVDEVEPDVDAIVRAFRLLSSSHKAFKGLDGAAHEAYQRTHTSDEVKLTVAGRAKRTASRTAAVALGLGACELCELITYPERFDFTSFNGTLEGREVLFNGTNVAPLGNSFVNVLVLYESEYIGGAGIRHGNIDYLTEGSENQLEGVKGRILIIIDDGLHDDLNQMLKILEQRPRSIPFRRSGTASVQSRLHMAASSIIRAIGPILQMHNSSAVHITGRALSGGIASLAAAILEGALPIQSETSRRSKKQSQDNHLDTPDENGMHAANLQGIGRGRVSAMILGTPPCISSNVGLPFVTSILYGDDVIGRASPSSLDRFYKRTRRAIQQKSMIGKKLNWMTEAASMATSNIQAHAFTSKDNDSKLVTPGIAYLIRPRRLGNHCSMHEIGTQLRGGTESLRAAILWQLNDILLSRSMWKHHQLGSYIHGLDRVHLRGLDDNDHEI